MPAQHTDMTRSPRRRSEDDLRAALASLEAWAPSRQSVLTAPAGSRRSPQPRRRIAVIGTLLVAGVAAVVVLSSTTASSPSRPTSYQTLRRAILTAFSSASGMVIESRATVTGTGAVTGRTESWLGPTLPRPGTPARYRFVMMSGSGRPVSELVELYTARRPNDSGLDEGFVGSGGVTRRITTVDYHQRTWTSQATRQDAIISLSDDPALLRHEVARGQWRLAGHVTIDGRPALELVWRTGSIAGRDGNHDELRRTLWVDAHTYLPIRQRIQLGGGLGGPFSGITANYRLLPPTAANLARLRPVVPRGFTRLHGPNSAVPMPVSPFL